MSKPIKKGDLCEIVDASFGNKSPNIGKVVTVGMRLGEHSQYGNVWEVHGEGLISEFGAVGNSTQCAQSWLRLIEPPEKVDALEYEYVLKA